MFSIYTYPTFISQNATRFMSICTPDTGAAIVLYNFIVDFLHLLFLRFYGLQNLNSTPQC